MSHALIVERAPAGCAHNSAAEPTLDAVFVDMWVELNRHRATECPVCGEAMAPMYSAHARPVGGRCAACGTEVR
jgi:uncharacterized protein (DUF983 family)